MNGFSRYLLSTLLLVLAGIASAEIETVTWLHTDHLGSPLMARDAQGNTLWQEDYSPWGERLAAPSANSADIGYTGHYEEADIGLTYAQARWYDPAVGRFLSADAVGFGAGGSNHFNRYTYAYNSPYVYNDPDGKAANYMLRASWEVGSLGGRYVAAPLINWTINAAVGGTATYTLGTYLYDVVHSETGDAEGEETGKESKGQGMPEVGRCPDCGGDTSSRPGKIGKDHDMGSKDVKETIHDLKRDAKISGNPDVEVCSSCGEVFPQSPDGSLGDSIGNINE